MIRIGVNASFLRKPYTGIGQVTAGFLREISRRDSYLIGGKSYRSEDVRFFLYIDDAKEVDRTLAGNSSWNIESSSREGISAGRILKELDLFYERDDLVRKWVFERLSLLRASRADRLDAFVSLYQSATTFSRLRGPHHVMVVHDIIPEVVEGYRDNWRKRLSWSSVKRGIRRSDKVVAVSSYTEKDLISHLGMNAKQITVSPISVDPAFSEPIAHNRANMVLSHYHLARPYFLCAGGLEKRKNVENVLRAYKQLRDGESDQRNFPDLVIVGKLMPELAPLVTDVETLVRELNLTQCVHLTDVVGQRDMPVLYQEALATVFPSEYEGFGMPILESMRAGTPVITTKKTSLPEVAGDAALYCDGSVGDIERAMREIISDENLRKELRRRGAQRAMLFSWERFTDKVLATLM